MRRITTRLLAASAIACGAVTFTAPRAGAQSRFVVEEPTGWVGVTLQTDTSHRGKASAYPVVSDVVPESPADRAGLVPGDTILKYDTIDARVVSRFRQFLQPGRRIRVTIRRNEVKTLTVVVGKRPGDDDTVTTTAVLMPSFNIAFSPGSITVSTSDNNTKTQSHLVCPLTPIAAPISMSGQISFAGATLMQMNSDMAQLLRVENRGVLVIDAPAGTQARAFGLKGGDVILTVGGSPVRTPVGVVQTISKKIQQRSSDTQLTLQVLRNGQTRRIKLQR